MNAVWLALGLTTFAGLATGVGSVIAFAAKRTNYRFLSVATGFSAGVMLYVSFVEIFWKGGRSLAAVYGDRWGMWINVGSFFGGMLLIGIIDNLIPSRENPHEIHAESETAVLREPEDGLRPGSGASEVPGGTAECPVVPVGAEAVRVEAPGIHHHAMPTDKLLRMGLFTALAIGIHNFPEGLATFLAVLEDPGLGVAIAVAIALHNIPEGISVAVPIYYATGKRRTAFVYSVLSGLAEPVGAVIAYLILSAFLGGAGATFPPQATGILFTLVAGIMVYISLDELLPTSRAYGKGHDSLFGLVAGMLVMALSLLLLV